MFPYIQETDNEWVTISLQLVVWTNNNNDWIKLKKNNGELYRYYAHPKQQSMWYFVRLRKKEWHWYIIVIIFLSIETVKLHINHEVGTKKLHFFSFEFGNFIWWQTWTDTLTHWPIKILRYFQKWWRFEVLHTDRSRCVTEKKSKNPKFVYPSIYI